MNSVKLQDTQSPVIETSVVLLHTGNEQPKIEIRREIKFTVTIKIYKMHIGKLNQYGQKSYNDSNTDEKNSKLEISRNISHVYGLGKVT